MKGSKSLLQDVHRHSLYLYALFDPEVAAHGFPVLRAANIEQPLIDAPLHGRVKHLEVLGSDQRLSAPQPREKSRLQL